MPPRLLKVAAHALWMLVVGCSSEPISNQARLGLEGNRAYGVGHYEEALSRYTESLAAAQSVGDQAYVAMSLYGAARASIQLCRLPEAEALFRKSIAAREALSEPNSPQLHAYLTQNLWELGRLLLAQRRYAEANEQFDRAAPMLVELGVEQHDPIEFANALDERAASLRGAGRFAEAEIATGKSAALRAANPGRPARFIADGVPAKCAIPGS